MSRRRVREVILQIIFQIDYYKEGFDENAFNYMEEQNIPEEEQTYIREFVEDLIKNKETIDETIGKHLKSWTIGRLSKIDLAILRVSTYEMLLREDIPKKVSMNEAIELTKRFSDEESRKFVNGVLDSIANSRDE